MDDPDTAHLRVAALSRLLDRVITLEGREESELMGWRTRKKPKNFKDFLAELEGS